MFIMFLSYQWPDNYVIQCLRVYPSNFIALSSIIIRKCRLRSGRLDLNLGQT